MDIWQWPRCSHCLRSFPTQQAVNTHIGQSKKCSQAWANALAATTPKRALELDQGLESTTYAFDFTCSNDPNYSTEDPPQPRKRAHIEDDPCNAATSPALSQFVQAFPKPVGSPVSGMKKKTLFEKIQDDQTAQGVNHWAPFNNQDEWDLA